MKVASRALIAVILCTVCVIPVLGQASKTSRDEIEVRAAIGNWANAVRDRDQKALDALFAEDLFITDYIGGTRGKREELEVLKPSATVKTLSVTNENIVVRVYGKSKSAVVTAMVKMVFENGGKQNSMAMRYTSVWVKRKGSWQLVVLQTARVAQLKT